MVKHFEYDGDDYWAALYRRRRIIALMVVLSAVFSTLISFLLTPLYESSMQFYVPQDIILNRGVTDRALIRSSVLKEQARTYVAVLEARDAHSTVADQLGNRSTGQVLRAADFDITPAGSLIIYARDSDPVVATRMVELFFEYFKTFHELRLEDSVKVVQRPSASNSPVFPITILNTIVGGIGGLLLGIIYALFLDYLQVRMLASKLKRIEGQDWFEDAVSEELNERKTS
jgi:capsular polysaccharide biosynthesis protein